MSRNISTILFHINIRTVLTFRYIYWYDARDGSISNVNAQSVSVSVANCAMMCRSVAQCLVTLQVNVPWVNVCHAVTAAVGVLTASLIRVEIAHEQTDCLTAKCHKGGRAPYRTSGCCGKVTVT